MNKDKLDYSSPTVVIATANKDTQITEDLKLLLEKPLADPPCQKAF